MEIFEEWFEKLLVPYVRKLEGPVVLLGDNLSSHLSLSVIRRCQDENIRFVLLPANSTHLCQPLDVSFYHPLKEKWRGILNEWKNRNIGVLPKCEFPRLLKTVVDQIGMKVKSNIIAGFKSCGIVPFNPQHVISKVKSVELPAAKEEEEEEIGSRWSNALIEHLRATRAAGTTNLTRKTKGRRLNIAPGKCVVVGDVQRRSSSSSEIDNPPEVMEPENNALNELEDLESNSPPENEVGSSTNASHTSTPAIPPDDEPGPSTCVSDTSTTESNSLKVKDFVLVKFPTNKRTRHYIGVINKVISKEKFQISFFRKRVTSKNTVFVFPNVEDVQETDASQIVRKVAGFHMGRGRYNFVTHDEIIE